METKRNFEIYENYTRSVRRNIREYKCQWRFLALSMTIYRMRFMRVQINGDMQTSWFFLQIFGITEQKNNIPYISFYID